MLKLRTVLAVAFAGALAVVPVAQAATFGVEVFGALNTHSMEEVNDAIKVDNTKGANFDELTNGVGGGLGVRIWPNASWMITACWEPLFVETESKVTSSTRNLDATSFQVSAFHFFPSNTNARFGVGGGMGIYSVMGEHVDGTPLTPTTVDIEGSGPGFHFMGVSEWTVSPGFAMTAGAGYRISSIEVEEGTTTITADYSGFMGRVGLTYYFPSSK